MAQSNSVGYYVVSHACIRLTHSLAVMTGVLTVMIRLLLINLTASLSLHTNKDYGTCLDSTIDLFSHILHNKGIYDAAV